MSYVHFTAVLCRGALRFWSVYTRRRETILYIEYQSVCSFVQMAPSAPRECFSPLDSKGWGGGGNSRNTRLRVTGRQFRRLERKPVTLSTL